jgi:hypothetical protein
MDNLSWIEPAAQDVIASMQTLADFEFGYDDRSVAMLEDYLVRMRRRGAFDTDSDLEGSSQAFGAYLGEAIIAAHGGKWGEDEDCYPYLVYEGPVRLFPINKMAKLMRHGLEGGESILSFYHGIPGYVEIIRRGV